MNEKLNEYSHQPKLSDQSRIFIENYDGTGIIPDDIRDELEKYVKDNQPFFVQANDRLKKYFENII